MRRRYCVKREMWCMFIVLVLTALFITRCSDNPLFEEVTPDSQLKNMEMFSDYIPGEAYYFKGIINDDSIEIVIPPIWNGSFMVYAHGYVDPIMPIKVPDDAIAGIPLKTLLTSPPLSFAYAATSYSENGFAVKEGVKDVLNLGKLVKAHFKPAMIFVGGVSEGGLVATKALEKEQNVFNAGFVSCAPIGNFLGQLKYLGDFHVLFKYYYAGELAAVPPFMGGPIDIGSPEYVSPALMNAWTYGNLKEILAGMLATNPVKLKMLLQYAQVPVNVDALPIEALVGVAMEILRFNIMATNDMIERVHGVPYDNMETVYPDAPAVVRIQGDKQALHRVELLYETAGTPKVPIFIMHTLGDHVVPAWHMDAYLQKVNLNGMSGNVEHLSVAAYGHCNFTLEQVLYGINRMTSIAN